MDRLLIDNNALVIKSLNADLRAAAADLAAAQGRIWALGAENEALRKALGFYANPKNWEMDEYLREIPTAYDRGDIAREALQAKEAE